eukprot:6750708-Lingulodinium_polyedra.AAC.1
MRNDCNGSSTQPDTTKMPPTWNAFSMTATWLASVRRRWPAEDMWAQLIWTGTWLPWYPPCCATLAPRRLGAGNGRG